MLFAVHISDGVLEPAWLLGGFVGAAILVALSLVRLRDEEVPRIALLTAAFFIVSLIHVRVGPTSVHLLFNGLIGILLGWRAALALAAGLLLQYLYLPNHGGIQSLGVNTCVLAVPALAAWLLFHALHRYAPLYRPGCQFLFVTASVLLWVFGLVFSVTLLFTNWNASLETMTFEPAWRITAHPLTVLAASVVAVGAAAIERRLENAPEFALGLLLGMLTVLASVGLNCAVLVLGGVQHWTLLPLGLLVAHLPIAIGEGVVLGFTVGFLAKVKPEMLGITPSAARAPEGVTECAQDPERRAAPEPPQCPEPAVDRR